MVLSIVFINHFLSVSFGGGKRILKLRSVNLHVFVVVGRFVLIWKSLERSNWDDSIRDPCNPNRINSEHLIPSPSTSNLEIQKWLILCHPPLASHHSSSQSSLGHPPLASHHSSSQPSLGSAPTLSLQPTLIDRHHSQ